MTSPGTSLRHNRIKIALWIAAAEGLLTVVGVIFEFALLGPVLFCFCLRTTFGASGAAGGGVLGLGPVLVVVGFLLGNGGGATVVVGVVDGGGELGSWLPVTVVVFTGGSGVVPAPVVVPGAAPAPSAVLDSCPLRLAAVRPLPASADTSARHARRRGRFNGCIRRFRSSCGRPMVVVGAAGPQTRGTPTRIHIGRE